MHSHFLNLFSHDATREVRSRAVVHQNRGTNFICCQSLLLFCNQKWPCRQAKLVFVRCKIVINSESIFWHSIHHYNLIQSQWSRPIEISSQFFDSNPISFKDDWHTDYTICWSRKIKYESGTLWNSCKTVKFCLRTKRNTFLLMVFNPPCPPSYH